MSDIYKLSGFQQELDKAERFFTMHLTRQELKSRLDEIERLKNIIKEARELLNQEWYSVLRKETITKVREILDKENK